MTGLDAVIFDFDDTLVATNHLFDQARLELFAALRQLGCEQEGQWPDFLAQADEANVAEQGFLSKDCFPRAIGQTYRHFAAASGLPVRDSLAEELEQIGWRVYAATPALIEGAEEVLQALRERARLFLLTQGDAQIQLNRIQASGLLPYFRQCYVVQTKDQAAYERLIATEDIDRRRSWMVGNSLRSDINPALAAGLRAAHFTRPAWSYEDVEPQGEPWRIQRLLQLMELIKDDC